MSRPDAHVQTVTCPNCGKQWTGHFLKPPEEALCVHCLRKRDNPDDVKNHPDLTLGSGRF